MVGATSEDGDNESECDVAKIAKTQKVVKAEIEEPPKKKQKQARSVRRPTAKKTIQPPTTIVIE